jgi:hypothetical protein
MSTGTTKTTGAAKGFMMMTTIMITKAEPAGAAGSA